MRFASGTRLGPYEINTQIGAGGMGEVWKARDTRLDRNVAIKVLPDTLVDNPKLRARFDREARTISQLNHPNICSIYDVGHESGVDYLVMELLDGETLAARVGRGALPLTDVVRIGAQIGDALAAAHRAGIIHRDLKPGNIMLTKSGAKLLDFGLAKSAEPISGDTNDPLAATAQMDPLTVKGSVIGTLPYMSPEQLQGQTLDHRSDIFSFGIILYEMATGIRPFPGHSSTELFTAILTMEPAPIDSLLPAAPPALVQTIFTALRKDPEQRWQTAHDLTRQLLWIGDSVNTGSRSPVQQPRRAVAPAIAILLAAGLASLATFATLRYVARGGGSEAAQSLRLQFAPPAGISIPRVREMSPFVLSPDGRTLCFMGTDRTGNPLLLLRDLHSSEVKTIEGAIGASAPFWSSDGEWIGYSALGKLWKIKVSGGGPEAICELSSNSVNASWVGSTILFGSNLSGVKEIQRVSASGGVPEKVTTIGEGEWRHTWPRLLADGEHFIFQSFAQKSINRELILASLKSPKRTVLLRNVSFALPVGGQRLLYVREGTLMSEGFDPAGGKMTGDSKALASEVSYFYPTAGAAFTASSNGTILYRTSTQSGRIVVRDRTGTEIRTLDESATTVGSLGLSRDGKKVAAAVVTINNGFSDLWIYDIARSVRERFTSDAGVEAYPVWAHDGRSIVYSNKQGGTVPYLVRRSLSNAQQEELLPPGSFQIASSFSPDGLLYYSANPRGQFDIFRMNLDTKTPELFLGTSGFDGEPEISFDGKWMAFVSWSQTSEIYLYDLSGKESDRIRVSANGGREPRWRSDGRELFFVAGEGAGSGRSVMSATQRQPGNWADPVITELFNVPNDIVSFAVLPDGKSFVISDERPGESDALLQVIVGSN